MSERSRSAAGLFGVVPFVVLAIAVLSVAAGHASEDRGPRRPASPVDEPLAVTSGDATVPLKRLPDAGDRAFPSDQLLSRVPPESLIAALIESTSTENVRATIERLQAYGTRYVSTDSCAAAGRWIRERFLEYGYNDVRTDTFRTWTWQDSVDAWNILAYKTGSTRPSEHVVLGGHYDSVTWQNFDDPNAPAPGAEDNASGVAGVLEAARVLSALETERSIVFACWSAEEEGLWGSRAFVADAVADSMDIVLYLNMDAIGYLAPPEPDAYMMADSSALAVAAWMCDVAGAHTDYHFIPTVRPLGASDHNSFWEAGYNVVDSQVDPTSHHMHTPDDVIENLSVDFATAIVAVNVVTTAAVAGVIGEDANLPPETTLVDNCAAASDEVAPSPVFAWRSVDFDGEVAEHHCSLVPAGSPTDWVSLSASAFSVSFSELEPGAYVFSVRAIDDDGIPDPSPAVHVFAVNDTFAPLLTVDTNFLPQRLSFQETRRDVRSVAMTGTRGRGEAVSVYENEFLTFTAVSDASGYCGRADSVTVAVGDTSTWEPWSPSPLAFVLRPAAGDTVVHFRTRDENGATTTGSIRLNPVPAPMDVPLLHIDDWFGGGVPEDTHDAFYRDLLAEHEHVEWDPIEHLDGGVPSLPSMEELGRYKTVLWTAGPGLEFLRGAQSESAYHYVEGFVRAGGNFILEGRSPLTALTATDPAVYDPAAPLPRFVFEHVGIDSMVNSGASINASVPESYGWTFLGGKAVWPSPFDDVPVDTLGKWSENYSLYGGVPWCEVVWPTLDARRIYLFDSFLNPALADVPCATLRYAEDGTGVFAYFGFPFYFLESSAAEDMVETLLEEIAGWQEPADLIFFDVDAKPRSVTLTWYLNPAGGPSGCHIERYTHPVGQTGGFVRLNSELLVANDAGRFSFVDSSVDDATSYSYRLRVVEQWGGETVHGPWSVDVPAVAPVDALAPPVPNPATRSVGIHYTVASDHRRVVVAIYDCSGRLVRLLREGVTDVGDHVEVWDGTNESGRKVASGVYFVRAELGGRSFQRKVVVLR